MSAWISGACRGFEPVDGQTGARALHGGGKDRLVADWVAVRFLVELRRSAGVLRTRVTRLA